MPEIFDAVIVGGGVIGLSLADEWLSRRPADSVLVLEKEPKVALHASGRNSGVLHAGFYYSPDSLKARLTKRGNELLTAFIVEEGLPLRRCGKVVVASDEAQLPTLGTLAERAAANGVDVEVVNESELRRLEPLARTVDRALFSPTTAVSDPVAVTEALAKRVMRRGGTVALGETVLAAGPGQLTTEHRTIQAGHVLNAAGLYADRVAQQFGYCDDYRMLPFKGLYWYGSWPAGRLTRHVYPVPDPANPFLGVHLTVTADGRTKIGPTAMPALWREDYGGVANFDAREAKEIAGLYPAFLASPHHRAWTLVRSEIPKYSRHLLVSHARRLVPSAATADFRVRGRPGVRAQLFHLPTRQLEMDFVVRGDAHSTHVLNAVSPAWTSALAFAGYVMDDLELRGG
ncbi:MAG TPA: L-2-hydroxyglutarate oxidase [Actinomycetota bacterium]|nr:L-2-hydroxyglutarate oxidase [Actinomycetota bacterium]